MEGGDGGDSRGGGGAERGDRSDSDDDLEAELLAVMEFGNALGVNSRDKETFFPSAADETVELYHGTHISFDPYAAATKGFGGRHPYGGRKHRVKETLAGGGRINLTFRRIVERTTGLPA